MKYSLSAHELRILGCLLEKSVTTPEQYPLSLNALLNACNQKSNREPVMSLTEPMLHAALNTLQAKYLVAAQSGPHLRVAKYRQRWCNTEMGTLKFKPGALAIMGVLMLRGPQTPGELRSRTQRWHAFSDVAQLEAELLDLQQRSDGPWILKLPREAGRRECRYQHLVGQTAADIMAPDAMPPAAGAERPQSGAVEESLTATQCSAAPAVAAAQLTDMGALVTRMVELEARVKKLEGIMQTFEVSGPPTR